MYKSISNEEFTRLAKIESDTPIEQHAIAFTEWLELNRANEDTREGKTHTLKELYFIFKQLCDL